MSHVLQTAIDKTPYLLQPYKLCFPTLYLLSLQWCLPGRTRRT